MFSPVLFGYSCLYELCRLYISLMEFRVSRSLSLLLAKAIAKSSRNVLLAKRGGREGFLNR